MHPLNVSRPLKETVVPQCNARSNREELLTAAEHIRRVQMVVGWLQNDVGEVKTERKSRNVCFIL